MNEFDKETYFHLKENIKESLKNIKNIKNIKIRIHNIDSTLLRLPEKNYDLILCDPPWGGNDYKQNKQ